MVEIELNFQRYVRERRGAEEARLREGAAYAYGGDLKILRSLEKVRPVTLAVEAAVRLWKGLGEERLLGEAHRVTEESHPALHAVAVSCAATLHIPLAPLWLTPRPDARATMTLGTNERPYVVLSERLLAELADEDLRHFVGGAFGHVHNHHTLFLTTLHFLREGGGRLVKWASAPAGLALGTWARRAQVTADRAGLLCTRSLETSIRAVLIESLGTRRGFDEISGGEYLAALAESNQPLQRLGDLASRPHLAGRLEALRAFGRTAYFRGAIGLEGGTTTHTCDAQIHGLL
jgi:Zn-dependent protease with chaperone function